MNYSNSHLVLARKYRPSNFSELIGQDHLVKVLNNSIIIDKLAHAYLLTGIRGIGKTTTARIIAKTINCENPFKNEGILEPCNQCSNCNSFKNSNHPDILELDAASKTGVSDIREIIDNSSYTPVLGKYKIYIIDEVHMLSNSAFNALLKTLEEPPAHLKFIFATTEPRKIPLTIVSRCQKFDLKSFSLENLSQLFAKVCSKEGVSYEEEALKTLAIYSHGSARDGLSLLEMLVTTLDGQKLETDLIINSLGISNKKNIIDLLEMILQGNTNKCLEVIEQNQNSNNDFAYLLEDLLSLLTEIAKFISTGKNSPQETHLSSYEQKFISDVANKHDLPRISSTWQMIYNGIKEVKNSDTPNLVMQMLIIRICHLSKEPTPVELISQIKKKPLTAETSSKTLDYSKFNEIVNALKNDGELVLYYIMKQDIAFDSFHNDCLILEILNPVEKKVQNTLRDKILSYTKNKINVVFNEKNTNTVNKSAEEKEFLKIKDNDVVKNVLNIFSGAEIEKIKTKN